MSQHKRASSWVKPEAGERVEPAASNASVRAYALVQAPGGYRLIAYELPGQVAEQCEQKRYEPEVRQVAIGWLEQELDREHGL